jgi:hypothetical protein
MPCVMGGTGFGGSWCGLCVGYDPTTKYTAHRRSARDGGFTRICAVAGCRGSGCWTLMAGRQQRTRSCCIGSTCYKKRVPSAVRLCMQWQRRNRNVTDLTATTPLMEWRHQNVVEEVETWLQRGSLWRLGACVEASLLRQQLTLKTKAHRKRY